MQLDSDKELIYDFETGAKGKPGYTPERKIDRQGVIEYFGVPPEKVIDVQALVGDTSDNVPGVPGIAVRQDRASSALITEYGDLETLLARAPEIKQPKRRELLTGFAEQARLSKKLVTLDCNVDPGVPLASLRVPEVDGPRLIAFLKAMELFTLTKRVGEGDCPRPAHHRGGPEAGSRPRRRSRGRSRRAICLPGRCSGPISTPRWAGRRRHRRSSANRRRARRKARPRRWRCRSTPRPMRRSAPSSGWRSGSRKRNPLAGLPSTRRPPRSTRCAASWSASASRPHRARPATSRSLIAKGATTSSAAARLRGQVPLAEALERLKPLLEDAAVLKIAQNHKYDYLVFSRYGITVAPYDDTMLLAYALEGGKGGTGMDELAQRFLGYTPIAFKDVAGTGRNALTIAEVALDKATEYSAEDADADDAAAVADAEAAPGR